MMKNSEWGAAAYLSASSYGAGVNKVQINSASTSTGYTTGCGPQSDGDEDYGSTCNKYNTTIGQLASTTNNTYGIYDMSGGVWEYVMGGYSTSTTASGTDDYISTAVQPPYADIYPSSVFTNNGQLTNNKNNNQCTWAACGGHALYETKTVDTVSSSTQSWGSDLSKFVYSSYPWFLRGGDLLNGSLAGVFASSSHDGDAYHSDGFRVVLL